MEAAASNTTMASHLAWERQAQPSWKYIKAILADSGLTRDRLGETGGSLPHLSKAPAVAGAAYFRTWPTCEWLLTT